MFLRYARLFLVITSFIFCSTDSDIDGVDDSIDLCPNTPFDVLVDKDGCPQNKLFPGKLVLQLGSDITFNQTENTANNLNIYADYMIKEWDFSISSSNYYSTNISTNTTQNDLYLTAGYTLTKDTVRTKFSVGTKFDLSEWEYAEEKRENDYYTSINMEYFFQKKHNIFIYYSYTISGDSKIIDYEDFHSVSAGYGYSITDKWYTALSYNYAQNTYPNTDDYRAFSWYNAYQFNTSIYALLNYAHTLKKSTYSHTLTIAIGVKFD